MIMIMIMMMMMMMITMMMMMITMKMVMVIYNCIIQSESPIYQGGIYQFEFIIIKNFARCATKNFVRVKKFSAWPLSLGLADNSA